MTCCPHSTSSAKCSQKQNEYFFMFFKILEAEETFLQWKTISGHRGKWKCKDIYLSLILAPVIAKHLDQLPLKVCAAVIVESPLKAFLTRAQFWQAHLVSSSCLVISTDQSHTSEVAAILKHLYGNYLPNENVVHLILTRLNLPCPVSTWSFTNLPLLLQNILGILALIFSSSSPPLIIHSRFMEAWPHGAHQDRQVCLQHF